MTGTAAFDDARAVTLDSSGNIIVAGETEGSMSGFTCLVWRRIGGQLGEAKAHKAVEKP